MSHLTILSANKALIKALLVLLCLSCQQNKTSVKDELLVYCSEGSPASFNPQLNTSGTSLDASAATIYNQLLGYEPGTTEIRGELASNWKISRDGLRYQIELRENVAFHGNNLFLPTRTLNADDVIFSFNRQRLKNHPYHLISGGQYPYFDGQGLGSLIKGIKKLGEYKIEFVLSRPESPFLSILASPFAAIFSKEYADFLLDIKKPYLLDSMPLGTGPFRYVDYEPDAFIRFERFDQHYLGAPRIKSLVYSITPDAAMRFARFSAGECDVMSYPLPVHVKIAKQQESIEVLQIPGLNVAYWAFNTERPPFNNPKVRKALSMAINKEAILRTVYDNQATSAKNPIPPSSWAYNQEIEPIAYSPLQAKALLSAAGYNEGFSIDIWAMPVQRAYNPNARKMAEMMQQNLLEIGVEAKIITYQWQSFLSRVQKGYHQTVLLGWNADNGDPDNFFSPLLSCNSIGTSSNYAHWCDKRFDQLIMKARQTSNQELRSNYYHEAQQMFKQETPWLTLAHANNSLLIQKRVQGLKLTPIGSINFDGVYIADTSETLSKENLNDSGTEHLKSDRID